MQQQGSCIGSRNTTALQIKQLVFLQLRHRCTVGATHVISNDLQLRLGVHTRPLRKQQIAAQLGCIGALGFSRDRDRAIKNRVRSISSKALLQLIELALRPGEPHSGMGCQLLIPAGDGQALQRGLRLTIDLNNPRLDTTKGPAFDHGAEGVGAARLLLHRQMGQQRGCAISRRQETVAQLSFLTEMHFKQMGVRRLAVGQNHLENLELGFLFQQQQHPCCRQARSTAHHQFQGRNGAANPQRKDLLGGGVIELNSPIISTTTTVQGVPKGLLKFCGLQQRDALWQGHAIEGITDPVQHNSKSRRIR